MKEIFRKFEDTAAEILKLNEKSEAVLCDPIYEGKWSIRDIVGHLYYWDKFILEKLVPLMADGADLPPFPEHDKYNAEALAYLKNDSVATIIEQFIETRKQLTKQLAAVDNGIQFTIGGRKKKFSGESFTKMFLMHDEHHLKQITEKLHR
ncbi:DinB family protein [Robertmurraya siralis]|uniref:DinB family protein n=1 Tax=Robertmurraya siralis TaxID=77777 RepID=UPI000BA6D6C5|nr:DinB family protein [Robertmurraya siralis]PAE19088.1 hypothetical protein CHH80_18205 [Bacillus sp. 7504-2]